jgi:F-type H+-transporting ATPase subunit delta
MTKANDPRIAKALARHFAETREEGLTEGLTMLRRILEPRGAAARRAFLKLFRRHLRRALAQSELVVEHTGDIPPASLEHIRQSLDPQGNRIRSVRTVSNPALIGGLRLTLGDDVHDASIAGRLQHLQESVI